MAKTARSAAIQFNHFSSQSLIGAAGFVRVGRTDAGQCWLIDADNRPFFSRGVSAVNRYGRATGRGAQPTAYAAVVEQRYGSDPSGFVQAALERLRSWNCNTLGPGSGAEFFGEGMFFIETIGFRHALPEAMIKLAGAMVPDVFDPRWVEACEVLAAQVCAPLRQSRALIGYITDHELQWSQPSSVTNPARPGRPSLLQICLSLEPGFPAYHAAWEFVLAPHAGELGSLAKAWGIEPNKQALRLLTLADTPLANPSYLEDQERFTREFARRYFQTCATAIRRCDPNHLVLGCSFESPPGPAVLAESVHPAVDLLAIHCGDVDVFGEINAYARATGLPVLITAFSWVNEAFVAAQPGRRRLTAVERMLANARASLTRAFAHPALVGYSWSPWADLPEDVPPFGRGLVHHDDVEAREHTELLRELNRRAEALHRAGSAARVAVEI
jgi:hypothetical protein